MHGQPQQQLTCQLQTLGTLLCISWHMHGRLQGRISTKQLWAMTAAAGKEASMQKRVHTLLMSQDPTLGCCMPHQAFAVAADKILG